MRLLTGHRTRKNPDDAERRIWSAAVLGKYWLLQLPETALVVLILLLLRHWYGIPGWVVCTVAVLWVAKDVALYPLVWRSFDPGYPATQHALEGQRGVATERLEPSGYIRVRGELWRAELARGTRPVGKDEVVEVRSMRGLTVIVVPVSAPHRRSGGS